MGTAASASIKLASELDIKAAAPLAAELNATRGRDLRLDASRIERIGGQCLQVLLSAAATWATDGAELTVEEPSPAFIDAIGTAGFALCDFTARSH